MAGDVPSMGMTFQCNSNLFMSKAVPVLFRNPQGSRRAAITTTHEDPEPDEQLDEGDSEVRRAGSKRRRGHPAPHEYEDDGEGQHQHPEELQEEYGEEDEEQSSHVYARRGRGGSRGRGRGRGKRQRGQPAEPQQYVPEPGQLMVNPPQQPQPPRGV